MIGIIMAGGKGSRMSLPKEKLLLEYKKPVILHVVDALKSSGCFSKIIVITSSNSPNTRSLLLNHDVELLNSSGNGYVQDLNEFLRHNNDSIFVSSGDLPFLDGEIIQKIVKHYNPENIWTSILVTKDFLNSIQTSGGYEVDFNNQSCCYTGISLINAKLVSDLEKISETFIVINDKRIGFNLNTKEDFELLGTA